MATSRQIDYIAALASQKGYKSALEAAVAYGFDAAVSLDYMSATDASGLIDWLKSTSTETAPAGNVLSQYAPTAAPANRAGTKCIVDSMPAVILRSYITATGREMVEVLIDDCDEETLAINSPRLTIS